MRADDYSAGSPGRLVTITVSEVDRISGRSREVSSPSFIPGPLPERLELDDHINRLLEEAIYLLGTLNGIGSLLVNPALLARPFVRREAVSSSRIEGTATTFEQLLHFELGGIDPPSRDDAVEVLNYVQALEHGMSQPVARGITSGLIREIHEILMTGVRSDTITPGRFRRGYVFIGGIAGIASARFVPPPATEIPGLMLDFEREVTRQSTVPRLIRIGMLHYQFEVIHPFNDGNGRTGRLLIALMLRESGLTDQPLLHLSNYFERHKEQYLTGLQNVSLHGDWTVWSALFLNAVAAESARAIETVRALWELQKTYQDRYEGRWPSGLSAVIDSLFADPMQTITGIAEAQKVEYNTAKRIVTVLERDGVLVETTGKKRNRVFMAPEVMRLLEE